MTFITKYHIGDRINDSKKDFTIIEKGYKETPQRKVPIYKIHCNKCGYEGWKYDLQRGCPVCAKKITYTGVNDIATTHPELLPYFVDSKDSQKYSAGSGKRAKFKCPICGYEKSLRIYSLATYGFSCPQCGDGISYPNKFSRAVLKQLPVQNIIYEYIPNFSNSKTYRYDNYFEYNDNGIHRKFVWELDGAFHYVDNCYSGLEVEHQQAIDAKKDEVAKENGLIVIRTDCRISTKEYIRHNIICGELSKYFDLSNIDWDYCDKMASNSLVYDVCSFYNKTDDHNSVHIGNHFGLSGGTIVRYLLKGADLGLCDYSIEKAQQERLTKSLPKITKGVNVYDMENVFLYTFDSLTECANFLKQKYNTLFDISNISKVCKGKATHYKNFIFKYSNEESFTRLSMESGKGLF